MIEDGMRNAGLELLPLRKNNPLRSVPAFMTCSQALIRNIVETIGSWIERLLPKSIHSVTAKVGVDTSGIKRIDIRNQKVIS